MAAHAEQADALARRLMRTHAGLSYRDAVVIASSQLRASDGPDRLAPGFDDQHSRDADALARELMKAGRSSDYQAALIEASRRLKAAALAPVVDGAEIPQ